jgi:PhzF family phenazine biosynthesis protein
MQSVAAEMNLAETAFVVRQDDRYSLRWFTPKLEVSLCGHATLAAAHVLFSERLHPLSEPIRFETISGTLTCTARGGLIEMDFPSTPPEPAAPPPGLLEALGVSANYVYIGKSRYDAFVVVDAPADVRSAAPDMRKLASVPTRGVILTSRSDDARYDFLSRFFAPAAGIDEDPVTGSAHCCLAPYWASVLGRNELIGYQTSPRGGVVRVRLCDNRVILGGQAVTVLRGELT